jgi:hypothetical protein
MIMIPATTPPTIPPITPPERPFWAADDELPPELPIPADGELLFVVVRVGMLPVAVSVVTAEPAPPTDVAVAEFPPPSEVVVAEFPSRREVVTLEGIATVPVTWVT